MRALLIAISVLFVAEALADDRHFISPNGEFEAYTIPANDDGTGAKLFLHRVNSRDAGVLLKQNNRWIDAKWSPDYRFVAIIDHLDGHISDVYVFSVGAAAVGPTLLYHTPDLHTYDVRWDVIGWQPNRREVVLLKEVKNETQRRSTREKIKTTREKVVARIGTEPLKLEDTE
jgi:hypothetical protein